MVGMNKHGQTVMRVARKVNPSCKNRYYTNGGFHAIWIEDIETDLKKHGFIRPHNSSFNMETGMFWNGITGGFGYPF